MRAVVGDGNMEGECGGRGGGVKGESEEMGGWKGGA